MVGFPLEVGPRMSDMDVRALEANFNNWASERAAGLRRSKAFERYVFEQVLKDHDPADEDLDVGNFGDGDDGGVDGMYLYIGGQLIGPETPVPAAASDVELHIIQAKEENGFKETVVEKLEIFARDLFAFDKPVAGLAYLNSKAKDAISNFRTKYDAILGKPHTLSIFFHYVCVAPEIPSAKDKVMIRSENLTAYVKSVLTLATVHFVPWSAATLLESVRSMPYSSVTLPYTHVFSDHDQSTVCLVKLTDFATKLLSTSEGHLQTRFLEPNVRDYQGRSNTVNDAIRKSLENSGEKEDFWWLNNGITVLATSCHTVGAQIKIEEPEIVNGLQTSHEVFNWYSTRQGVSDDRKILLRIIVSADDNARMRIIKATNSQTKVSELNLLSTEPIQQTIDDRLRLYGLFYDRKKGQCRRLKRPIARTVGMRAMAQAVIAVALREPDEARGRPETYVHKHANKVFDPEADGELFAACITLDRTVETFLWSREDLTNDEIRDVRYFMDTYLISVITGTRTPTAAEIIKVLPGLQVVDEKLLKKALDESLRIYRSLGGTDKNAKSKEMTMAIEEASQGYFDDAALYKDLGIE
jgi:hypothetical protein